MKTATLYTKDPIAPKKGGKPINPKGRSALYGLWRYMKRHPLLYIMLIPGLFFLFIYKFLPLYGITMAFNSSSRV